MCQQSGSFLSIILHQFCESLPHEALIGCEIGGPRFAARQHKIWVGLRIFLPQTDPGVGDFVSTTPHLIC